MNVAHRIDKLILLSFSHSYSVFIPSIVNAKYWYSDHYALLSCHPAPSDTTVLEQDWSSTVRTYSKVLADKMSGIGFSLWLISFNCFDQGMSQNY